jgi:hypothetical protein
MSPANLALVDLLLTPVAHDVDLLAAEALLLINYNSLMCSYSLCRVLMAIII